MTDSDAYSMIIDALEKTGTGLSANVTQETHLTDDKIIDSLDSMNFLFELETLVGQKLTVIDETFDDFRMQRLVEILRNA